MHIDTARYPRTAAGHEYRVLASDLPGDHPIAIHVNGEVVSLRGDLSCPTNPDYTLAEARLTHTRYVNAYRSAEGSFCFGSRSCATNEERLCLNDTQRALFGLEITWDEGTGNVTATKAATYY